MKKHGFWKGIWNFELCDKDGNVLKAWSKENALADEGESLMLDGFFRGQNRPTAFYVRLFNDTPVETDTLAALTGEPSGNGYAAQTLSVNTTDFPTLELDAGDYQVVSKQVVFTAAGGAIPEVGSVTYAVLATTSDNTGKLVAFVELSEARRLPDTAQLKITFTIKLQ